MVPQLIMKRVKFKTGMQKKFIDLVIEKSQAPSLRAINQFGLDINYSTLKNYYNESRTLPYDLFIDLCGIGEIDPESVKIYLLEENWGKRLGGLTRRPFNKKQNK